MEGMPFLTDNDVLAKILPVRRQNGRVHRGRATTSPLWSSDMVMTMSPSVVSLPNGAANIYVRVLSWNKSAGPTFEQYRKRVPPDW